MADDVESFQATDAIGSSTIVVFSPSVSRARSSRPAPADSPSVQVQPRIMGRTPQPISERAPLLGSPTKVKKPFYRARPLWLVPFALFASVVRGMTLGPRVEVFTQLSCNAIYGHDVYDHTTVGVDAIFSSNNHIPLHIDPAGPHLSRLHFYIPGLNDITSPIIQNLTIAVEDDDDDEDEPDPRELPSKRCLQDPAVQAGAARLQTTMTFTMGVLSALTTGWWSHFGEHHGRTKVLSAATLGLLLTDLMFILVSTPHSMFAMHGHNLLIISPMVEGLLGGWSTLQAAITAYVSDCTSDGSRAQVFSRFTGVSFFGLSIGPTLGAFLITHPLFNAAPASHAAHGGGQTVTSVFYISAMCSFVNLMLALFVFPEPTKKAKISEEAQTATGADGAASTLEGKQGILTGFLAPFALLAPRKIENGGGPSRKDWRLTYMALTLLVFSLSAGIFQIKYLYAEHIYGWGASQLSYYISAMGFARTMYLLVLMPIIIMTFKPKPDPIAADAVIPVGKKKAPPTPAQLAKEMRFDFMVLRGSLAVDILSHLLVSLSPEGSSAAQFTAYTALSSFGAGVDPAMHSLALCIMQANGEDNRGKLFGAFAMLRTVGQMIIGPLLFGLIYSTTVSTLPKAIFMTAGSLGVVALAFLFMVRTDVGLKTKRSARSRADLEIERGRSRVSKDIGQVGLTVDMGEGPSSSAGSP